MAADHQKPTVVEEGCTGSRKLKGGCSVTDNYDKAITHNSHNIYCKIRISYSVTDNLNA